MENKYEGMQYARIFTWREGKVATIAYQEEGQPKFIDVPIEEMIKAVKACAEKRLNDAPKDDIPF